MRNGRLNKKYFLVVLLLLISLGYALLSSNLTINGNTKLKNSSWDIHFENVVPNQNNVSLENEDSEASITINNNTEVTYNVTLSTPGDFYEFEVDAVNDGTVDAMIDTITSVFQIGDGDILDVNSTNLPAYLNYSATYADGSEITLGDIVNAGDEVTYKIRVEFKKDITSDDLPSVNQSINFNFQVNYVQAKNSSIENHTVTFNKNNENATGEMDTQSILERTYTALDANSYSLQNYRFIGWNTKADGTGISYLDEGNIFITDDITLYAQWGRLYTLTFDKNSNDAVGEEYSFDVLSGVSTTLPDDAFSAYTLTNMTIENYNTMADNQGISYYQGQSITISSNTTLYAHWKGKPLYSVLETEALTGGLAREYTGEHGDSMDSSKSTEKIYHWYAINDTQGTQILDKNNVIFAGQCWQMIRTTDTGGVKMIYNGEAENNQCLSTRGNHVGYAGRTSQNLASNYWYGTDYTYDKTNNVFSIAGTTEQATWNATTGPNLIGKYTCKQTTEAGTCATLYLVESYYNTSSAYVITLNSNSNYSQFGTLQFNVNDNSPADVGYMYNTRYIYNKKTMTDTEYMLSSSSLNTTYWYGDNVTWGSPTANSYNLGNPSQVTSTADYPSLVGKYTFRNTSQTYTNTSVYYIAAVSGSNMYYIYLDNTGNHTLTDFNYTYTYGDSFTDNGNGTYTITNPTTINRSDWYTSYSNVNNKYVCKNAVNNSCSELWYTTSTSNTSMTYIKVANNYKYSKGFIWDGSKYVLDDATAVSFWNINDSTNKTSLNNAHYTCWNTTGECESISYIYYITGGAMPLFYINISNGKSVEDAKNEMLYDDNVNTTNSTIKSGVDAWYKQYLSDYSDYLEDTIFCNDRRMSNADTNGWNPNGGNISTGIYFKEYDVSSYLSCPNDTDKFSVSNDKAKLTYKVGLMSYGEMELLNNDNVRKTGQRYWLASPYWFDYSDTFVFNLHSSGDIGANYVIFNDGVRPAVSLTQGTEYSDGDGSMANPFIIAD